MLVCLPGGIRFCAGPTSTAGYPRGVIRLRRLKRRGSKVYERLATEVCRLLGGDKRVSEHSLIRLRRSRFSFNRFSLYPAGATKCRSNGFQAPAHDNRFVYWFRPVREEIGSLGSLPLICWDGHGGGGNGPVFVALYISPFCFGFTRHLHSFIITQ